jgi:predicted phage gp36 major capsid-like protein
MGKLPWRWIGAGIGALLIVLPIYNAGKKAERARLMPRLELALANAATLKAGIADQSAAIAAQGHQEAAVAKASAKAIQRGAERRGRVDAAAARVEAVQPSGGDVVPDDVRALWRDL